MLLPNRLLYQVLFFVVVTVMLAASRPGYSQNTPYLQPTAEELQLARKLRDKLTSNLDLLPTTSEHSILLKIIQTTEQLLCTTLESSDELRTNLCNWNTIYIDLLLQEGAETDKTSAANTAEAMRQSRSRACGLASSSSWERILVCELQEALLKKKKELHLAPDTPLELIIAVERIQNSAHTAPHSR